MARQMERDELSDILTSVLTGGMRGYTEGRKSELELRKDIWKEKLKQELNPPKYEPRTQEEALGFERAKAGIEESSPKNILQREYTQARLKNIQSNEEQLTPMERRQQRGDTSKLMSALQTIPVKRTMINEAKDSVENLPKGLLGKWQMKAILNFDPENPLVEDWQKVKMVLTDAQLMNTAVTKGAISDREMELFAKAAANDDVSSVARNKAVFNRLTRFLDAEEKGLTEAYAINYGEKSLEKVKNRLGVKSVIPSKSTGSTDYKTKYGLK